MDKSPYNKESIRQYLLGTLAEAETERFDELSFTDDNFVESVTAAEKDLIDDYVQGQLGNSLTKEFEARYLASPLKRENVELAHAFHSYRRITGDNVPKETGSDVAAGPTLFSLARWRWQWGVVGLASLVLAFIMWSVFFRPHGNAPTEPSLSVGNSSGQQQNAANVKSNEPLQAGTPEVSEKAKREAQQSTSSEQERSSASKSQLVSVVLSPQMRGTTNIPLVAIPAKAEQMAVRLELEPNDFSAYRVVLLDHTEGEMFWRSKNVFGQTKDGSKTLSIQLPLQRLRSGSYVLRVYGLTESGKSEQMSDYHFRFVK